MLALAPSFLLGRLEGLNPSFLRVHLSAIPSTRQTSGRCAAARNTPRSSGLPFCDLRLAQSSLLTYRCLKRCLEVSLAELTANLVPLLDTSLLLASEEPHLFREALLLILARFL